MRTVFLGVGKIPGVGWENELLSVALRMSHTRTSARKRSLSGTMEQPSDQTKKQEKASSSGTHPFLFALIAT
jgi:hypothetical protein